jgi:4-amino-4-deoxy-L-arabinose transferase-like glycosyltransferase
VLLKFGLDHVVLPVLQAMPAKEDFSVGETGSAMPVKTSHSRSPVNAILVVLGLALLLRVLFLILTHDLKPLYDGSSYLTMAEQILASGGYNPDYVWPPGYPYFVAGVFLVFGKSVMAVRALQVGLSLISVYLIYIITRRVFESERVAVVASVFAAVCPSFIAFSHYAWSETLFIFILLSFVYVFLLFLERGNRRLLIASAVLFGLGSLTRGVLLPTVVVVVPYLWSEFKGRLRATVASIVIFLLAAGAVLAPWTIRNLIVYRTPVLISPNMGLNLWAGNSNILKGAPKDGDWSRLEYLRQGRSVTERERYAYEQGIKRISEEQPTWILKKAIRYLHSWSMNSSFTLRWHLRKGLYGNMPGWFERIVVGSIRYVYLVIMLAAILGLTWTTYSKKKWLLVGILLTFSAIYLVTLSGNPRLRIPLVAILIMFSGEGCVWAATFFRQRLAGVISDQGRTFGDTSVPHTGTHRARLITCALALAAFIYNSAVDILEIARRIMP